MGLAGLDRLDRRTNRWVSTGSTDEKLDRLDRR
jgi:hypothetical protein